MHLRLSILLLTVVLVSTLLTTTPTSGIVAQDLVDENPTGTVADTQATENADPLNEWVPVASGVDYREFRLDGPVRVYVSRMHRDNPNVIIESSIAQGRLNGGHEPVSGMAARYDQALNYWGAPTNPVTPTWGSRNNVVVAINGFFYGPDFEPSGVPWSGQIYSGWYAKRFYDNETGSAGSGFAWKMDRSTFIGGCVSHPADKQFVEFERAGVRVLIDGINKIREENELILYTPQYDSDTNTEGNSKSLEVLVEMTRPTFVAVAADMSIGTVKEIRDTKGSTPIPFDHIVLSAHGTAREILLENVKVEEDDKIEVAQRIKHGEQDNCLEKNEDNWVGTYASIAGSYYFLMDGVIRNFDKYSDATARNPRTAVAYNEDFIFFIVVDGRSPVSSIGMNINELANFTKNMLGATEGIAQDGGGSSTMVVNGEVKNNVFCNNSNCPVNIFLPVIVDNTKAENISNKPSPSPIQTQQSHPENSSESIEDGLQFTQGSDSIDALTGDPYERWVANGLMMVVVEPISRTNTFSPDIKVTNIVTSNLRLGPGTNYAVIKTMPMGTPGVILDHTNDLNGVYAKGYYWWRVQFVDQVGWMAEKLLEEVETTQ